MFRKILFLFLFSLAGFASLAQSIDAFKYQAILRTGGTQVIANQNVAMRFSIREGNPNGPEVYSEEHLVVTNAIGLVNLEVGNGQNVIGDLRALDWGDTRYFVRTELDANGGSNFAFLGVSELLAVPYAFKAGDVVQKQDLERTGDSIRATDNANATWLDLGDLRDNTDDQSMRFQNGLVILSRELTEDTADLNPFVQARLNQFGLDSVLNVSGEAAGQDIENLGRLGIGTTPGFTIHIVDTVDQVNPNYSYSIFGQIQGGAVANRFRSGMYIEINGSDGENIAVDGTSLGNSAGTNTGVGGFARGSSTFNRGVHGFGDGGQNAIGVMGEAQNGSAGTVGVLGQASNSALSQAGVRGFIDSAGTSNNERNWGVNGFVLSESTFSLGNIGVEGAAQGSHTGDNVGVLGSANNGGYNVAGFFEAGASNQTGTNGFAIGARGASNQASGGINYGLYGEASNSTFTNRGVIGVLQGPTNRNGNLGLHLQDAAVYGLANGTGWNTAVLGRAIFANPTDTNVSLLGYAANGAQNYALWTETGDAMFNDTAIFNYGTIQSGYVLTTDANGRATWQPNSADSTRLSDADSDTRVQVEANPDEDLIRFILRGTEYFHMDTGRFNVYNTGESTFMGLNAGGSDDLTTNRNTAFGYLALADNVTSIFNTMVGWEAGKSLTGGNDNSVFGANSFINATSGNSNTVIGYASMNALTSGAGNVTLGAGSGNLMTSGSNNVLLGVSTAIGSGSMSGSIRIGSEAGGTNMSSNTLFIENSNSTNPLIYGDFATDSLRVHGSLTVDSLNVLSGANNGFVLTTDANGKASWQAPASEDTTNEIISSMSLVNDSLEIIENGFVSYVDLGLFDNGQALIDTANAIRSSLNTLNTDLTNHISNDADLDSTNEVISNLQIINDSLVITENGSVSVLDMGRFDNGWERVDTPGDTILYNQGYRVGVGLNSALSAPFQVRSTDIEAGWWQNVNTSASTTYAGTIWNSGAGTGDRYAGWFSTNGTGSGDKYAGWFSANGTGGPTNYGLYSTASGAATNWAGYFNQGDVYINNNLGIGVASPARRLDVGGDAYIDSVFTDSLYATLAVVDSFRIGNEYSFPSTAGTNGQVLQYNGSSDLIWASAANAEDSTRLADADNDTKIQVEETADEDIIRFDVGGFERMTLDSTLRISSNHSGAGVQTGIRNVINTGTNATTVTGTQIGLSNVITNAGTGSKWGVNTTITHASAANITGSEATLTHTGSGNAFGFRANLTGGATSNYGLYSSVRSTTTNYGLYLDVDNASSSYGVYGEIKGDGGTGSISIGAELYVDSAEFVDGIYLEANGIDLGTSDLATGVTAKAANAFSSIGVIGEGLGVNRTGSEALGVYGRADGAELNYGGLFEAFAGNGTADTSIGIYATASGSSVNYAGFFDGNVEVSDTLIIPTGASAGYVLTSDANGKATWQASGSGTCPSGMQSYGGTGCIDEAERTAATWFVADSTCASLGYQLADYGDWYGAASNSVLTDETDDWEWVRNISQNKMVIVGNGALTARTFQDPTLTAPYRCTARIE